MTGGTQEKGKAKEGEGASEKRDKGQDKGKASWRGASQELIRVQREVAVQQIWEKRKFIQAERLSNGFLKNLSSLL